MKNFIMLKLSLNLCIVFGCVPLLHARQTVVVSLDGQWNFCYTGATADKLPVMPPAADFDGKIAVPGQWDDQLQRFATAKWRPRAVFAPSLGPVQYLSGVGWHRRTIAAPADWAGRAVTLIIGGGVGNLHVWLNGEYLGHYKYGVYTPWELDLTGKLKTGAKNDLVIALDNASPNPFGGWAFLGNSGRASGLSRGVSLEVSASGSRVADIFIKPGKSLEEVEWWLDLDARTEKLPASKILWSVQSRAGGPALAQGAVDVPAFSGTRQVKWSSPVPGIKSWSDREPNLYVTRLRWQSADGRLLDERQQRFGLRRFSHRQRQLLLNGQPFYPRLEMGGYYFPIHATTPMSKDFWLAHFTRLKELGLNGMNFAAHVCPPELLEAADELGVIVQCGDQETTQPECSGQYRQVWEPILRTTRKYPSMCIYGFGGELQYYEGVIEQYKAQRDYILSLHPESLVMPQQAIHGVDYGMEDMKAKGISLQPFPHHAERLARYTEACDLFGHYSGGAFSHRYFSTPWREMDRRFRIYEKPLVAHELFLSASYLDPANAAKYTGRIPPYIYTRLENDLRNAGILDKWPLYFEVTSRLQHICRKYCVEKARKCHELSGYEILGMMDCHFALPEYAVGVVDEFLKIKPGDSAAGVRRYLGESVLLLDFDQGRGLNRCYWAGDRFEAEIMVSFYGPKPLAAGRLRWQLLRGGEIVSSGTDTVENLPNGRVSTLKKLQITWPTAPQTQRLRLAVTLEGEGTTIANDWDFWVFPRKDPPAIAATADRASRRVLGSRYPSVKPPTPGEKSRLHIVSRLNAAEIEHLETGGDVLLLGSEPLPTYTMWPTFAPAKGYRPFSNGGTIIRNHPIFAGHPNEGWGDWFFFPLLEGANCVLFDGSLQTQFDPLLEIISSAGQVRKQALIFEKNVGKGRLLVATTVFNPGNPSCVTLLDSILRYMAGDEFKPAGAIDPADLLRLLQPPSENGNLLVDGGFERTGYWTTGMGRHTLDKAFPHSGKQALKLSISPEEFRANANAASSVGTRHIGVSPSPKFLRLAVWVKSDGLAPPAEAGITATVRYKEASIRSDSFTLRCPAGNKDWVFVEQTFKMDGVVSYVDLSLSLAGGAGSVLLDDLFFGAADGKPVETAAGKSDTVWSNKAFTRVLEAERWIRVDGGEWKFGKAVRIDQEGVHTLELKKTEADEAPQRESIGIDLSPPVTELITKPLLLQEAGMFTTPAATEFALAATDGASGVRQIEYALDGGNYVPYVKPFHLTPGKHVIKARAADFAGNCSTLLTGDWTTGNRAEKVEVDVRESDGKPPSGNLP